MKIKEIVKQHAAQEYEGYLEDVCQHGCASGVVSDMIYYYDTLEWYKTHKEEINDMLSLVLDEHGVSVGELLKDWEANDPLALETQNQNLLAWFAYEQAAWELQHEKEGNA